MRAVRLAQLACQPLTPLILTPHPPTPPPTQIRIARAWGSAEARQALLRTRLLSFYVAFQSNPSPTEIVALFTAAPDFVQQVRAGWQLQ